VAAQISDAQRRFIERCRVGRLTTVDGRGEAFAVPICYAFDGVRFFTPIDEKPKRTDRPLKRVRNIQETGRATLLIDHYDDTDWSRLAWVMVRGPAMVIDPEHQWHAGAVEMLRDRYSQYRDMRLETAQMIVLEADRVTSWGELDSADD
jgi:PPOX class probable F420-dependent enzyme